MTGAAAVGVSAARACAYAVVRRVFEEGAYADRAFAAEAERSGLEPRDRALAMRLAYGAVQRRATLDHFAARLAERPLRRLDPPVVAALRLGLLQLLFLDGIAEHAAVSQSVELVKAAGARGAGLVNAVLRRGVRERDVLLAELDDATPRRAAIAHSVPEWLAAMWWRELGPERARSLLRTVNRPAEAALRVNPLRAAVPAVLDALPVPARPAGTELPEGLVLDGPFDVFGSSLWREGAVMAQSRGSMQVSRTLAPRPGERVLDLCAAPGAKTTHLAALMEGRGEVVAVERNPRRAEGLAETCARMGASAVVRVEVADAAGWQGGAEFDRVLIDPPCSGLGTLQSRPDIRWRASPAAIGELAALQARILAAGASALAPGGVLVYSVCTISRAEGGDLIDRFLAECEGFEAERPPVQLAPDRDGTDGFFVARLRRASH